MRFINFCEYSLGGSSVLSIIAYMVFEISGVVDSHAIALVVLLALAAKFALFYLVRARISDGYEVMR